MHHFWSLLFIKHIYKNTNPLIKKKKKTQTQKSKCCISNQKFKLTLTSVSSLQLHTHRIEQCVKILPRQLNPTKIPIITPFESPIVTPIRENKNIKPKNQPLLINPFFFFASSSYRRVFILADPTSIVIVSIFCFFKFRSGEGKCEFAIWRECW